MLLLNLLCATKNKREMTDEEVNSKWANSEFVIASLPVHSLYHVSEQCSGPP